MLDGGLVAHHQHRRDNSPKPEERQDAERVLEDLRSLCRAAQAYEEQHIDNATLTGFLEQAAGLHAHEIAAGRTRPADHRLDRSIGRRGPRRSSSCCSAARSGCCPPGARSPHPTESSSPRSAACSTSPAPAPKTS